MDFLQEYKRLKAKGFPITDETINFVTALVWDISFGLRAAAVDALKVKAIEKASAKALQHLEQSHD